MRLNQITVPLIDYDASKAFYLTLGLKLIVDSPPRYARFEMPEGGSTFSIEKVDGWTGGVADIIAVHGMFRVGRIRGDPCA